MKLSHYTSQRGLIGIVRSQGLWATNFLALNDQSEFTYGLTAIWEEAIQRALPRIPDNLRDPSKNIDHLRTLLADYVETFKKQVQESDGYGSLFVTSFARARDEDEDERGILTLWDRYTQNKGYCLQFNLQNIRSIVSYEGNNHTFGWFEATDVVYGIDVQDHFFLDLSEQMALRALRALYFETRDPRFMKEDDKIEPESSFIQKLVSFCGKHKDRAFQDEREFRIFACPANVTDGRIFTGPAIPKNIYRPRRGPRYIVIGEDILPGVVPDRILIGPKAEDPSNWVHDLYPAPPTFKKSTIPIQ